MKGDEMGVLGIGEANGAFSLLHAAGIGYGASMALNLKIKVALRDEPARNPPADSSELLPEIIGAWKDSGNKMPKSKELHWAVRSDIPIGQGLKSSSAISIACLRALCAATDTKLETHELIDLATDAQKRAGVTITGSVDDSWATAEPGWKLVDPNLPAKEGVLLSGDGPDSEEWDVLIITRGKREIEPESEKFVGQQQSFGKALEALQLGQELVALTWNGRAVASALNDHAGRRLANDAFVNGGRAAGISGSGPAIIVFIPSVTSDSLINATKWYESRGCSVIKTKVINPPKIENEEAED